MNQRLEKTLARTIEYLGSDHHPYGLPSAHDMALLIGHLHRELVFSRLNGASMVEELRKVA